LFAQSAAQILQREFTGREVSYLLLDVHTGAVLASRWENADQPIPLGSLVKPFVALAYGEAHQFRYPAHLCRGDASGCWLPRGHGEIGISAAISDSCNSYFRMLTGGMTSTDVIPSTQRIGLDPPAPDLSGPDLIGVGNHWLISPLHMAHAYLELNRRRDQSGARELVQGMARSAWEGTGAEVDRALKHSHALVKTGTAACTHPDHAPGDGFVVALVPAEQPEWLLMVRVHGVPGAKAAATAGRMLSRIEE
jgi:cell division protein FtsI/penicillin-binding protein 2